MNGEASRVGPGAAQYDVVAAQTGRPAVPAASADMTATVVPCPLKFPELDLRWTIRENPLRHRVSDAAVFTIGSGGFATRAVAEETGVDTAGVLAVGVYAGTGPDQHQLEGPVWTRLDLDPSPGSAEWILDLRAGVLHRIEAAADGEYHSLRFACAHRPGVMVMRAHAAQARLRPGPPLGRPAVEPGVSTVDIPVRWSGVDDETSCLRTESTSGAIVAVAVQRVMNDRLDRVVVCTTDRPGGMSSDRALRQLRHAWEHGVDGLLAAHRAAWARRWEIVGIDLPDDPEVELAVRFALFQLQCNADAHGESAIGARGISGAGYRGHVFWDADVFVLPAMVSIDPEAAAAMLAYRLHRLPAARERARAEGYRGARFPWESASDGTDVTPHSGFLGGTQIPILTGAKEEHITADIAWAACHYAEWTGGPDFTETIARELLTDTARYWASRVRLDTNGRAHIDDVIGPDEYHESVNDNAYTNVMARWNLRRAARLTPVNPMEAEEFASWRELADRLLDQRRPDGRYEQFTGYFALEPLTAAAVGPAPMAADILLGRDRVAGSQLLKQPDVLMLHHLVPEEVEPGSLGVNLDYYGPRTTHGSSLSPAVMATLLARAGRPDDALEMLRVALRLDLEDRTAMTSAGLHIAALAGAWQAMLIGFAGVWVRGGVLSLRPALPTRWSQLGLAFRCLGRRIRLDLTHSGIGIRTDGPIPVTIGDRRRVVSGESWWPSIEKE